MKKHNTPERYIRPAFLFGLLTVCLFAFTGCDSMSESSTQSETTPDLTAVQAGSQRHCPTNTYVPSAYEFVPVQIQPEIIYMPRLEYPKMAKTAGLEGRVFIRTLVCENGDVVETHIEHTSGVALLDEAALDQARAIKFSPAIQNGHPVKIWVFYVVVFSLD